MLIIIIVVIIIIIINMQNEWDEVCVSGRMGFSL